MFKLKWLTVPIWFLNAVQPSFADDHAKLLGSWKIISYEREIQSTGERQPIWGKNPTGYIIFTPEGLFMAVLTGEGRKAPSTEHDRAELFNTMFAYTGRYRLEGDKWITKVDVAWQPARVGTEQVRYFRFDGDRLQVITAWMPPLTPSEQGMGRGILTFERAK